MRTLVPHQQTRTAQLGRRVAQSDSQRPGRRAAEFAQNEQRFDADGVAAPSVEAATISRSRFRPLVAASGQSGQRRTFAQHDSSGLGAVAGAASATSAAASSPPRKRASRRRRGRARPGRGMSPLRSQAPRCPMEQKRLKDTLGLTPERVSGVPLRGLEMCLAQAGSAPMARSQESRWSTGSTR